jgi:Undecaprenyl-phosphate glucose phosphotransferase
MQVRYTRSSQIVLLLGDIVWLNLAFLLAAFLRFQEIKLLGTAYYDYYVQLGVFLNLLWLLLSVVFKTYNTGLSLEPRKSVGKTLNVFFWHIFLLLLLLVSLKKSEYSRLFLTYFYLFTVVGILPWHFFYLRFLRLLRQRGGGYRKAVLVGDAKRLTAFSQAVQNHPELGINIVAVFSNGPVENHRAQDPKLLADYLKNNPIDEMYGAFNTGSGQLQKHFYLADAHLVRFRALPDLGLGHSKNLQIDFYNDVPVLSLRQEPLELLHNRILKRFGDVLVALFVCLFVFPWLMPLLAIGVKLSGLGPLFFTQTRSGYHNQNFKIYKLRTMVPNPEANQKQAEENDTRITAFGQFLRKHHLDELPQFWNILLGNMSLVGPRPHMLSHTQAYQSAIEQYMVRHFIKPGLTGLAQVKGFKGEHDLAQMQERVKTDVYYLENWSALLDVSIVLRTLGVALKGASA